MNNKILAENLQRLGLSEDEALIYLKLLKDGNSTHLRLSRETGVTRSKIYRIVESLEAQGLVARTTDDTGHSIAASDPTHLTIKLALQEASLREQRETLAKILHPLKNLKSARTNKYFTVKTYEGADGLRQMLWHELKTNDQLLVLGGATIEDLTPGQRFADRHRATTVSAGYQLKELHNKPTGQKTFTDIEDFSTLFSERYISDEILSLKTQTCVYNDVVSTYHWGHNQKVGFEVVSKEYAHMFRQIFATFWKFGNQLQQNDNPGKLSKPYAKQ